MEYSFVKIKRSRRKSIAIELLPDGTALLKAPLQVPEAELELFLKRHSRWLETHRAKILAALQDAPEPLTQGQLALLRQKAKPLFEARCRHYAALMDVRYSGITVRFQKTRWGSCSTKGRLNFNGLLLLCPPEVLDSVVVHELCHLRHMDHSPAFYKELYHYYPDYERCRRWLKQNGLALQARLSRE